MNLEKKRGFLNFLVIGASNSVADFIDGEASSKYSGENEKCCRSNVSRLKYATTGSTVWRENILLTPNEKAGLIPSLRQ